MKTLQEKIDAIFSYSNVYNKAQIDKALQELREQIIEALNLALDADKRDKVIAYRYVLDLMGEKKSRLSKRR